MFSMRKFTAHILESITMARLLSLGFSCFLFVVYLVSFTGNVNAADEERKVYIVYMGSLPEKEEYSPSAHHASILQEILLDSSFFEQSLVRSYTRSFNAFAAKLTEQERQLLAAHDDVLSVFPSRTLQPLTTESWDFMGFPLNASRNHQIESDIIIGVIDTGIWPESASFNDHGLGPPPKKWKGVCKGGKNFTCNHKIIGARHYDIDDSARDLQGHGSHTASTAAGNNVINASYYGIARGIARGGVPSARIAVYKVCSPLGCTEDDILAAFDDAIAEGVDILTVSIGGEYAVSFDFDTIAIGSFHAAEKGILTVNAAGNSGFNPATTSSVAPWLFTVAASITKRKIITRVGLGNGKHFDGNGINSFKLNGTKFPLVYGRDASTAACRDEKRAKICEGSCLDERKVKGKIVLCKSTSGVSEAIRVGALGSIVLEDDLTTDVSFVTPSAQSTLSAQQFSRLESYYNSTKKPRATIYTSQATENKIAPVVATFSSRGPNTILPDILKPDITAPGVDILAAYSAAISPSGFDSDKRSVKYSVMSGTSMACPHVAGAAAYVKSKHPSWSSSAIKSALMTTASVMNANDSVYGDAEFSYGAGFMNPARAINPGLVYETLKVDYVKMLCSMDFGNSTLRKIFGDNTTCPKGVAFKPKDLNYPTMSTMVDKDKDFSISFARTVTNVGLANSTYKATITKTSELNITVKPEILFFKALEEKKSFVVTVSGKTSTKHTIISASLEWSDSIHTVRSPIVVYSMTDE